MKHAHINDATSPAAACAVWVTTLSATVAVFHTPPSATCRGRGLVLNCSLTASPVSREVRWKCLPAAPLGDTRKRLTRLLPSRTGALAGECFRALARSADLRRARTLSKHHAVPLPGGVIHEEAANRAVTPRSRYLCPACLVPIRGSRGSHVMPARTCAAIETPHGLILAYLPNSPITDVPPRRGPVTQKE
jgi:hypothetical protein